MSVRRLVETGKEKGRLKATHPTNLSSSGGVRGRGPLRVAVDIPGGTWYAGGGTLMCRLDPQHAVGVAEACEKKTKRDLATVSWSISNQTVPSMTLGMLQRM